MEVDIRKFFDTLDHAHLRTLLHRRVRDGVLLRLLGKWLQAGVLEDGVLSYPESGTPQGGVLSPLLANIYWHYVLDAWFEREVRPCLHGRAFLIRSADDFVMGFACAEDARRVLDVLPKRFGKYGRTLHPDKTRLVDFRRPTFRPGRGDAQGRKPGSLDFLGFMHPWGRARPGRPVVQRRTARRRFPRSLTRIGDWRRRHGPDPVAVPPPRLCQSLRGPFAYEGSTGHAWALLRYREAVLGVWRKWLARRRRGGWLWWAAFRSFLLRFPLPPARVVPSVSRPVAPP